MEDKRLSVDTLQTVRSSAPWFVGPEIKFSFSVINRRRSIQLTFIFSSGLRRVQPAFIVEAEFSLGVSVQIGAMHENEPEHSIPVW